MIGITFLLFNFAATSVRIFTPTMLEKHNGVDKQSMAVIVGAGQVSELVIIPLCMVLIELLGRKPLVIVGFVNSGLGTLVLPLAKTVPVLAAALSLQQLSQACVFISMMVRASQLHAGRA